MNIVLAKELRSIENLKIVPNDKPGWYKWWASKEALEKLLDSPYICKKHLVNVLPHLTKKEINGKEYYYIYVGVAIKESIRARLNWHVNQQHTESSVSSGFLSTLRQTISSLAAGDQYNQVATNDLIDMLIVEYISIDLPIKSDEAKKEINRIENIEMEKNVLPLNIQSNKNLIVKDYKKELTAVRKKSKQK